MFSDDFERFPYDFDMDMLWKSYKIRLDSYGIVLDCRFVPIPNLASYVEYHMAAASISSEHMSAEGSPSETLSMTAKFAKDSWGPPH